VAEKRQEPCPAAACKTEWELWPIVCCSNEKDELLVFQRLTFFLEGRHPKANPALLGVDRNEQINEQLSVYLFVLFVSGQV
jgi:hypothetical protein